MNTIQNRYNIYFKGDRTCPITITDFPNKPKFFVELELSRVRLSRITRFYDELPEKVLELIEAETTEFVLEIPYVYKQNNFTHNVSISIYNVKAFDTEFMMVCKSIDNKQNIMFLIHSFDGFQELEDKFNVFISAT